MYYNLLYAPYTTHQTRHTSSQVYSFNCHFYTKLTEDCRRGSWRSDEGHKLVRRWTKHVDLFAMDFVFIPINLSLHWSLVVLARPYLLVWKILCVFELV
ncbi:hypothetical protein EON65_31190 [archaeon]|nr:MAG: hypothetical protein EON65_31190 [archaeon]